MTVLASWWVSDADLAAALETKLGAPIHYAPINASQKALAGGTIHTWSWGDAGKTQSTINVYEDSITAHLLPITHRFFWFKDGGVRYLEGAPDFVEPNVTNRFAYGELHEPMLISKTTTNYAYFGDWLTNGSLSGHFGSWGDMQCETPGPF
jgi:hypothetical protein